VGLDGWLDWGSRFFRGRKSVRRVRCRREIQAAAQVQARVGAKAKTTARKNAAVKTKAVAKKTGNVKLPKGKTMKNSVNNHKGVWTGAKPYLGGTAHPNRQPALESTGSPRAARERRGCESRSSHHLSSGTLWRPAVVSFEGVNARLSMRRRQSAARSPVQKSEPQ
jgi:hypothetical protein